MCRFNNSVTRKPPELVVPDRIGLGTRIAFESARALSPSSSASKLSMFELSLTK